MRHTGAAVIITDLDAPRQQFNSDDHDARFDLTHGALGASSCRSVSPQNMTRNT